MKKLTKDSRPLSVEWLPVSDIKIDHANYQREMISDATINKIQSNFSWPYFGVIIVAIREDGTLWACDGQHRLTVARNRGEKSVPCVIFESSGPEEEAEVFLGINSVRNPIHSADRFRANCTLRDPFALKAKQLLDDSGYAASKSKADGGCTCVGSVIKALKASEPAAYNAWKVCVAVAKRSCITDGIFSPFFHAEMHLNKHRLSLNQQKIRAQLSGLGVVDIIKTMTQEAFDLVGGGGSASAKGRGLVNALIKNGVGIPRSAKAA